MQPLVATPQDFVFINCPFDKEYQKILNALIYCVYRCGFCPITASIEDNALDLRLNKIFECINQSKYGIHDISRIELNEENYPRFNMPFELGLFFGCRKFGDDQHKVKNALIFEKKKYSYLHYISDLNGIDTKSHGNNSFEAIRKVRTWLYSSSKRSLPGEEAIITDYKVFLSNLPGILKALGVKRDNLSFNEYCEIVQTSILEQLGTNKR
ncbi:MAG: hypothetical protein WKF85_04275 [Chitinophagaceae bacterium]